MCSDTKPKLYRCLENKPSCIFVVNLAEAIMGYKPRHITYITYLYGLTQLMTPLISNITGLIQKDLISN